MLVILKTRCTCNSIIRSYMSDWLFSSVVLPRSQATNTTCISPTMNRPTGNCISAPLQDSGLHSLAEALTFSVIAPPVPLSRVQGSTLATVASKAGGLRLPVGHHNGLCAPACSLARADKAARSVGQGQTRRIVPARLPKSNTLN